MRPFKKQIYITCGILFAVICGILIYPKRTEAAIKDINPNVFIYTEGASSASSWYDTSSDCFIFQMLEKKRSSTNYYQTYVYEFSRLKSSVYSNPKYTAPYAGNVTWLATQNDNDPHWYNGYGGRDVYAYDKYRGKSVSNDVSIGGTKYVYTTYAIDRGTLLSNMKTKHPEWFAEYTARCKAGQSMWVGIDSVMTFHFNRNNGNTYRGVKYDNYTDVLGVDGWVGYISSFHGSTLTYGTTYDWSNWTDIKDALGLQDIHMMNGDSGVYTDFNAFIEIPATEIPQTTPGTPSVDIDVPEPSFTPEEKTIIKNTDSSNVEKGTGEQQSGSSKAAPYMFTYNTDDMFDLGDAIPSSETYTNGLQVFAWYGDTTIKKYRAKTERSITATIVWPTRLESVAYSTATTSPYDEGYHPELHETWTLVAQSGGIYYYDVYGEQLATPQPTPCNADVPIVQDYYGVSSLNLFEHDSSKVTNNFSKTEYNTESVTVPYNITINGENKTTGTAFANNAFSGKDDAHVTYPVTQNVELGDINAPAELDYSDVNAVSNYFKQYYDPYIDKWNTEMTSTNDYLSLNGVTYLDDSGMHVSFTDNKYYIGAESGDAVESTRDVTIPATTANGTYYTTLASKYAKFAAGSGTRTFTITNTKSSKKSILAGHEAQEGIVVHTPVVSPISIVGENKTQLTPTAKTYETQLILDKTYTVTFDWDKYFHYKAYDNPDIFKNYVKEKEVRFPFDVQINGTYYEANVKVGNTQYTKWISVGNVDSFKIYIPTWSKEGVYGSAGYDGYDGHVGGIQARVYAINYITGEQDSWQEVANTDKGNYQAVYEYPVQVSGVIYDFQVDSINDELLFGGYDRKTGVYSFVTNKEEKTNGTKNRFGESAMRYALDGAVNNDWSLSNVLPFARGSSKVSSNMGTLSPGHEFAFTLKTISNMYNKDDTVEIVPTFRYVSLDGTVNKNVSVYYGEGTTMFKSVYEDKNLNTVRLDSEYFKNCYFNYGNYDTIGFTADWFGKNTNAIMRHETSSYTYGKITLQSTQKLLTGDEEELYVNRNNESDDALRYQSDGTLGNLNENVYKGFEASMQTWYGIYHIPAKMYVCEKFEDGTDAYTRKLKDEGSMTTDSDIWYKDGYIVMGFDITTYVNGTHEHFTYYGGGLDMWQREQGIENSNTPKTVTVNDLPITVEDGDIAVIDLSKSLSDRYNTGILYIN